MKKGRLRRNLIITSFFFFLFSFGFWACKKKDTTCYAIIAVQDTLAVPVSGADVHLYATLGSGGVGDVEARGVTNASGEVNFEFKLQAIFNVTVSAPGGLMTGSGIIKLEPGETVEKTITVQ